MSIDVKQTLTARFSAPLRDNYRRRIIFWRDPEGEFAALADELCPEGVKLLKLTGSNGFAAKRLLSADDLESDYLVYQPFAYADAKDDWLLDIELYSEEFRADLLSIRMQEFGIPDTPIMRRAMKSYGKFFENKERAAGFAALHGKYESVGQLHIDILAVLTGATSNTASGVIRAILSSGLEAEENEALAAVRRFGSEPALWEMIGRFVGYAHEPEQTSLIPFAAHLLLTALSLTVKDSCLTGLEKLISEPHQQRCYDLINEWLHSEEDGALYDVAREVEERYDLARRFDALEVRELLPAECLPCINECILRRFMSEISDDIVKADDIAAAVEKRRTLKWYDRVRYYYDGLLQIAQMQRFYLEHAGGFHTAEAAKLWQEYTGDCCKMDHYYRQLHAAFGKSLKQSSSELEDLYKNVADYAEKLYKNWYLAELGRQWMAAARDELEQSGRISGVADQADFYRDRVEPIVSAGSRVYVIISDALRYEAAVELTGKLNRETKGTAKLSSMQAVFPSATKFGMAALLPHQSLELTDEMKVLCDGEATDGAAARQKVLRRTHGGNVALTYKDFLSMKQAERREAVAGAQTVYLYHNTIDAVGDKAATEDQVFDACEQAILELKNLVQLIANGLSGTNILITADHGFLYSYQPLEESDKAEQSFFSGRILELDRRYVIADGDCSAAHMLKLPLPYRNSGLCGFTPLESIRIKKQGGGMNYVHGGVSLQELAVPVIEYKNIRSTSKQFVDVKKARLQLISPSRKISNSIFFLDFYQKEEVGGKIAAATYEVYMADAAGKPVSDRAIVIADKTDPNGAGRAFRTRLTLKSLDFKKTDPYYLTVVEQGSADAVDRIEFTIDIAFVNDFDF